METIPAEKLLDLSGMRAIVTGAGAGIGNAIAMRLAQAGARVLVADKDEASAEALARSLPGAVACAADVSDQLQVTEMVRKAAESFGGIDVLVNNAGIYPIKPVLEAEEADFEKILSVNLTGAFFAAKTVAAHMIEQGKGGRIINITSIDALHPSSIGLAFYDASKHGLWGFTKNLALELAPHNIWVNAIAPGGIRTPGSGLAGAQDPKMAELASAFAARIPMGRMGEADEIAKVALFLASDMASYMTGSQIVVDGGRLLT